MKILTKLLEPIHVFFISASGLLSFLLGALADPQGLMNHVVIKTIDVLAEALPSTPDNLKISSILNSVGDSMPLVGRGIVYEVAGTVATIAGISLAIKIYKLIPFKAT